MKIEAELEYRRGNRHRQQHHRELSQISTYWRDFFINSFNFTKLSIKSQKLSN